MTKEQAIDFMIKKVEEIERENAWPRISLLTQRNRKKKLLMVF